MKITNTNINHIGKLRKIKSSYDLRSLIDNENSLYMIDNNNIDSLLISYIVHILLHNIIYCKMIYFYKKYYNKNEKYNKKLHNNFTTI